MKTHHGLSDFAKWGTNEGVKICLIMWLFLPMPERDSRACNELPKLIDLEGFAKKYREFPNRSKTWVQRGYLIAHSANTRN